MANALVACHDRPVSAVLSRVEDARVTWGRRISRTWYSLFQGPYTSVLLQSDPTTSPGPVAVSERMALSIAAVYRSLAVYSDLIGTMPVQRFRGETERLDLPPFVVHPAGAEVGWTDEIGQILWSLLLRGNAYGVPTSYDASGFPASFVVLDPNLVATDYDERGLPTYRYRSDGLDLLWINPGPLELLHLRWQRPPGALRGVGILDANAYPGGTLSGAWAANYFASEMMANPSPPAVLTHPMRLNEKQAGDLQTQWATSVGRSRSVPAVLSGGITYAPLALSARDAQLMETRKWNATDIATMFGLPPYMVGGSTGDSLTYATVEGEMIRLWTTSLMPMAVRLERGFSAWIPRGQRLRFVPDVLLRSQTLDRYQAHKIALEAGFETVDEVRDLENRPPLAQVPAVDPDDEIEEIGA